MRTINDVTMRIPCLSGRKAQMARRDDPGNICIDQMYRSKTSYMEMEKENVKQWGVTE